eukprot:COSAG01_NODE_1847_length_9066_cov_6.376603_4_plen_41_part_00
MKTHNDRPAPCVLVLAPPQHENMCIMARPFAIEHVTGWPG